jgi:ABC-type transport system involved in multi-copper enzyme maturation permease subunit
MYFLIIMVVAVVSLLVAAWFKQLDAGTAMFLLFAMQGPLFIYLAAHHQISSEVNNRTFPFLLTLPISRGRLWLAKLLFALIYALLLYFFYLILALFCGATLTDFIKFFKSSPAVALGIPIVVVAYGYFTSMLPRGFATIATIIIGSIAYAIFANLLTITTLNFGLLTFFLIVIFLGLSAIVFVSDRNMTSQIRGFKGIGLLFISAIVFLSAWSLLGAFAENSWQLEEICNPKWVPLNGGRQILWRVSEVPRWWDVVDTERHFSRRLLVQNLENGSVKQLGNRLSSFVGYEKICNEGFVNINSASYFSGFLRGLDDTIFDHNGNPLVVLPSPARDKLDHYRLIDDKRFIYAETIKNGSSLITEYNLYEKGRGNRVVFSTQKSFDFRQFLVIPSQNEKEPAQVYISGKSDEAKNQLTLVSVADGKRTLLSVDPDADVLAVCSDYVLFDSLVWNKEVERVENIMVVAWFDGKTSVLNRLNDRIEVIGINSAGNIVATCYLPGDSAYYNSTMQSLIEIDPVTDNVKELFRPAQPGGMKVMLTEKRDRAFVHYRTHNVSPVICKHLSLDFTTGEIREFEDFNRQVYEYSKIIGLSLSRAFHIGGSRFMTESGDNIYEIDVESMQTVKKTSYDALYTHMVNGGGQ